MNKYAQDVVNYLTGHQIQVDQGPQVVDGHPIPMFNVVCNPVPFEENEQVALVEILKCVKKYHDLLPGVVVVGDGTYEYPGVRSISVSVGFYQETATHLKYVGLEGGDIVELQK